MKRIIFFILFLSVFYQAWPEDLKGYIYNAKTKPIKGMKVWRKNTLESVVTNYKGYFVLEGITPADTIVISPNKTRDAVIAVNDWREIKILLNKKNFQIIEGEKVQEKEYLNNKPLRYSPNILLRNQIEQITAANLYELLKGRIPGVNVDESARQITIRGGTSFELDNEPLFIINGVEYTGSREADQAVTINQIEKLEVLKDGSMYGAKGANGVVKITTVK